MISLQLLRDDPEAVKHAIARKGEATETVDRLLTADARRRQLEAEANDLRAERNNGNRQLGELIEAGVIERHGRTLVIPDVEKVRRLIAAPANDWTGQSAREKASASPSGAMFAPSQPAPHRRKSTEADSRHRPPPPRPADDPAALAMTG